MKEGRSLFIEMVKQKSSAGRGLKLIEHFMKVQLHVVLESGKIRGGGRL